MTKERDRSAGNRSGLGHDLGIDDRSVAPGTETVGMLAPGLVPNGDKGRYRHADEAGA
jgi:hypothetical protein